MSIASSWAQDAPAGAASAPVALPKTVKAPNKGRTQAEPPIFEMEDSGCGGKGLFDDTRCLAKYLEWLDTQLNETYRLALAKLPAQDPIDNRRAREQLRKSQRAWLKYKDENCALVGGLTGGSNPNVTMFVVQCMEGEVKDRIAFLKRIANGEQEP
jgi:uncharacterized protein YecT (DUF1311 family)